MSILSLLLDQLSLNVKTGEWHTIVYYVIREISHKKNTIWLSKYNLFLSPLWQNGMSGYILSVMCFTFIPQEELNCLKQFWICGVCVRGERGVREEWRHGLLPKCCVQLLDGAQRHQWPFWSGPWVSQLGCKVSRREWIWLNQNEWERLHWLF